MIRQINQHQETIFVLCVLGLIDGTMVILGGYATFASRLDSEGHADRPEWLAQEPQR